MKRLELQACLDSVMAAAEFARESFPEVEDLCIFATGFGAYITLLCMEELIELPGTIKLVNRKTEGYVLPETGGAGTQLYTAAGLLLMLTSAAYLMYNHKKRRKEVT